MIRARVERWGGPVATIENARHSWIRRDGLLVGIGLGLGEATPLPGFGADGLDRAFRLLAAVELDALPNDVASIAHAVEAASIRASPSARFALETALLDDLARRREKSLAALIAGDRVFPEVPRTILVGAIETRDVFERAEAAVRAGARALKFKLRGEILVAECARLAELKNRFGSEIALKVDLNGVLDLERARRALDAYAAVGVASVEEPVSGRALLELGETPIAWFADESLADAKLADALLEAKACAGFVLKPTLLGGVFRTLELARRARRANKRVVLSHAFEGPVALAAAAEMALALGADSAGLDAHAALAAFPAAKLPQFSRDAEKLVDRPRLGLGLEWLADPWTRCE